MADFSYQVGLSINKQLPQIDDPLVDVDLCSGDSNPPVLRVNIAANVTASIDGVYSACHAIGIGTGTSATTIATATPFGTSASGSHAIITETSGNTAALATVYCVSGPNKAAFSTIGPGGCIIARQAASVGYAASCADAASTATLQIVIVGE